MANIGKKLLLMCLFPIALNAQEYADAEEGEHFNFTLEQCIEYAFGNSLTRLNLKLQEKTAELSLEQARNNRHPQVSGSLGESLSHSGKEDDINFSGNVGVNAGITLYQGRAIKNNIEKSRLEAERQIASTDQYDHNLMIQVLQYFLSALSSEEMLRFQKKILETSEEQLRQGQEKYNVGAILESDFLILKAQVESDKCNLLNSEISRDNALLNLKHALSIDPDATLSLVYPDTTDMEAMALLPPLETCVQRTLDSNPDIILGQYAIDIAKISAEITKAGRRPTISASAGIGTSHRNFENFGTQLGNNFNQSLGVSMNIPIYDKGTTKTSLKMRELEQKQAEINLQETELKLKQTVTEECQNVRLAYNQCKAYEQKALAYQKVYDAYNVRFQYGAITSVDLLQQQNNYINSLTDYVNSKYSFILKRKILDVYMDYPIKYESMRD